MPILYWTSTGGEKAVTRPVVSGSVLLIDRPYSLKTGESLVLFQVEGLEPEAAARLLREFS